MPKGRLKAFEQVTDPMGGAEVANAGKDPKIVATYMWGRWLRNYVIVPLVAGLGLLINQGIETLATNAEANRTLTDTLATLNDISASEPGSWSIYEEPNSGGGVNRYLQVEIMAPSSYKHLLATGWTVQPVCSYLIESSKYDATNRSVTDYYSAWVGTAMPDIVDNKITFRFSEHNLGPTGVLEAQRQYYMRVKATIESPEGRIQKYYQFTAGWYKYPGP